MERNRFSGVIEAFRSRPARAAGSVLVASSVVAGIPKTAATEPYVPDPVPQDKFDQLIIRDNELRAGDHVIVLPSPTTTPEPTPTEKPLSPTEKKIQKIKDETAQIYNFAKASGKFNDKLLGDLHDNLPFYLAASKKYGLDWVVLWVTEERESGASDPNSTAFNSGHKNSDVQGPYQISKTSWSNEFRTEAFSGLEYTLVFPQRHEGDARDTATAARILDRNIEKTDERWEILRRSSS